MGVRMAYWFGFAAVAGAFGGLIAFGIQHAHTTIENWRLLFIVEVTIQFPIITRTYLTSFAGRSSDVAWNLDHVHPPG